MKKQKQKELLELKKRMEESGIKTDNLVFMLEVPLLGIEKSYIIEEWFGIKVAKLLSVDDFNENFADHLEDIKR